MASLCEGCRLDFEKLRLALSVRALVDENAVTPDGLYLFCPACRKRNLIGLDEYGFFQRKAGDLRYFHWHSAPSKMVPASDGYAFKFGEMTLEFPDSLVAHQKFSVEQMCYPAVPVFEQLSGPPQFPHLPVVKEFLDLVDAGKEVRAEPTGKGEYRYRFHLRIRNEPVEIVRPALQVQEGRRAEVGDNHFRGVHLALWPKTTYRPWQRYFLRFGCAREHVSELITPARSVKVFAHASPHRGEDEPPPAAWVGVDTEAAAGDKGYTTFGLVETRPDWLAVEFQTPGRGEVSGGGVWRVEAASDPYPPSPVDVGLDFGTSNTCLATRTAVGLELLPITSCDDFIIHGSELPDVLTSPDTWPPRQGFGRTRALLPTEILTRHSLTDLRGRAKQLRDWRPVLDYSIPSSGLEVRYAEKDHVIAEFKWANMIADPALQPQAAELQKRYLELLLLVALAGLAARNAIGEAVTVHFSYPLAFSKPEREQLASVLREAVAAVSWQAGVAIQAETQMDESRAAARLAGSHDVNDSACLYVDIGGGSTDIALLRIGKGSRDHYAYISSFKYAGSALAAALAEKCLRPGSDISHFRRQIREVENVKELFNSEALFLGQRRNAITAKSAYFYAYLRQFLARLLAAHIITGEWKAGVSEEEQRSVAAEGYQVLFYPLGNGWGFGSFIDPDYARDTFCQRLTAEANAIIEEALRRQAEANGGPPTEETPRVKVKGQVISSMVSPKSAVAFGILGTGTASDSQRQPLEPGWEFRTVVGWTTQVSRTRRVPWYEPIQEGAQAPPGQPPLDEGSTLDCPEGEWPPFPPKLPTPHQLDADLGETRRFLSECSPRSIEHHWFVESPFHVLLEKLFKPALKELV